MRPSACLAHAPAPSQTPVRPHVATDCGGHSLRAGACPCGTARQNPTWPLTLQLKQVPVQADSQQTPSTQLLDAQASFAPQGWPFGCFPGTVVHTFAVHVPLWHSLPRSQGCPSGFGGGGATPPMPPEGPLPPAPTPPAPLPPAPLPPATALRHLRLCHRPVHQPRCRLLRRDRLPPLPHCPIRRRPASRRIPPRRPRRPRPRARHRGC
jgi:hypothetical protein